MIDASLADARPEQHDAPAPRHPLSHHQAREVVHQIEADEKCGRDALQHPIEGRLELADELRFEQRGLERRARHSRLDFPYVPNEIGGLRADGRIEIRADAISQTTRLADIK